MLTAAAFSAIPESILALVAEEQLCLVALEPPRGNGVFSVYFAASRPYRVLHVSFDNYTFRRMSWVGSTVSPADLSAIAYSFRLRAGLSACTARLEASGALRDAGLSFSFATIQ